MVFPEHFQQLSVASLLWIILYLNGLCVIPEAVVCGKLLCSTGIANSSSNNAICASKLSLGKPKSAKSEGSLESLDLFHVDRSPVHWTFGDGV